jgi:hypothetical protein
MLLDYETSVLCFSHAVPQYIVRSALGKEDKPASAL